MDTLYLAWLPRQSYQQTYKKQNIKKNWFPKENDEKWSGNGGCWWICLLELTSALTLIYLKVSYHVCQPGVIIVWYLLMHPCFIFIGLWHWCTKILAAKIDFTNQTSLPFWSFSLRIVVSSEFAVLMGKNIGPTIKTCFTLTIPEERQW